MWQWYWGQRRHVKGVAWKTRRRRHKKGNQEGKRAGLMSEGLEGSEKIRNMWRWYWGQRHHVEVVVWRVRRRRQKLQYKGYSNNAEGKDGMEKICWERRGGEDIGSETRKERNHGEQIIWNKVNPLSFFFLSLRFCIFFLPSLTLEPFLILSSLHHYQFSNIL